MFVGFGVGVAVSTYTGVIALPSLSIVAVVTPPPGEFIFIPLTPLPVGSKVAVSVAFEPVPETVILPLAGSNFPSLACYTPIPSPESIIILP